MVEGLIGFGIGVVIMVVIGLVLFYLFAKGIKFR